MRLYNSYNVEDIISINQNGNNNNNSKKNKRGINVYSYSDLLGISGIDKEGKRQYTTHAVPYFLLTVDERLNIFRSCAPVFGLVTGRMNKLSALEWSVIPSKKEEDKIVYELKSHKSLYDEYSKSTELKYIVASKMIANQLMSEMPELLPDMSNFDKALFRWNKSIQNTNNDIAFEIEEWLREPSIGVSWEDFIKQSVFDLMIHGNIAIYKDILNKRVENFYVMLGGTVYPARTQYLGGVRLFIQTIDTIDVQLFFSDEVCYADYIPTSSRSTGYVPLEALINKIAETLLFDKLMADQADGTKPPEKMVVFGDHSPFGDLGNEFDLPASPDNQERVEQILNERKKEAIRTLTGIGQPVILDLTRENTMSTQMERQKLIREEIALVYNASNLEINMSDSDGVSGRSTAESLETIDQNKGVLPIVRIIENIVNRQILPYRYGVGYKLEFAVTKDPNAELDRQIKMANSGIWSINEIRVNEIGTDPINDPSFDKPKNAQPNAGAGGEDAGGEDAGGGGGMEDLMNMMG